jgi:hypothetical protein
MKNLISGRRNDCGKKEVNDRKEKQRERKREKARLKGNSQRKYDKMAEVPLFWVGY